MQQHQEHLAVLGLLLNDDLKLLLLLLVENKMGLMLYLLEVGKGPNNLAKWRSFYDGIWYLLQGFGITVELGF